MIRKIVIDAAVFAREAHEGQMRKYSDLKYFTHPKAVARILEDMHQDEYMIAAALLHDVVEDTEVTIEEVYEKFGKEVGGLVEEVTNTDEERGTMKKDEYVLYKMGKMSERAITLKLADRLHNVLFMDRDAEGKEHWGFVKYYMKHTRVVLNSIKSSEFNPVQKAIYDRIAGIISYLEVKLYEK